MDAAAWAAASSRRSSHAQSRLRNIRNPWKQVAQLDSCGEFAAPLVSGTDDGSLPLGDNEHRQSIKYADRRVQVLAHAVRSKAPVSADTEAAQNGLPVQTPFPAGRTCRDSASGIAADSSAARCYSKKDVPHSASTSWGGDAITKTVNGHNCSHPALCRSGIFGGHPQNGSRAAARVASSLNTTQKAASRRTSSRQLSLPKP